MKVRSALAVAVVAATFAGISGIAVPAFADEDPASGQSPDATASLIADVAPNQGAVDPSASQSVLPHDGVSVEADSGKDLSVALPTNLGLEEGARADDGTVVYPSSTENASAAVQQLKSGAVRAQTIIGDATAPRSYSYTLGNGFHPAEDADGNFWAVSTDTPGGVASYKVQDAWARDANGSAVPTHYEIQGDSLVQVIEPASNAAYPIVADPTWQWYAFTYGAGFSKAETKHLASYGAGVGICGGLYKVPQLLAVCAVAGADWLLQAQRATNNHKCIFISVAPPVAIFWESKQCK